MPSNANGLAELGFTRSQLRAAFIYLFRGMQNSEFRQHFENGIAAKRKLDESGYVLLNCKLFAWAHARGHEPKSKDFGILPRDARFLRTLDLSFVGDYPAWSLPSFRRTIERQLFSPDMDVYIGKFISKKLRFLKSYGITRPDIANELRMAALYNMYRMYPMYKSELHIKNVAKRAIKNAGMDLIHSATKRSVPHLVKEQKDGFAFQATQLPLHSITAQKMLAQKTYEDKFDVTAAMTRLGVAYNKCTDRAKHFISLLMGQPDDEFSRFLGRKNEKVFSELDFDEYCVLVQSYLRITEAQKTRFFARIRRL